MNFIKNYVITLCYMLVIFALVISAIPENSVKKTLKVVIGIVAALIMVSPFLGDFSEEIIIPKGHSLVDYNMAENMERKTLKQLELAAEEKLKNAIHKKCKVNISAEGLIEKVEIENGTEEDKRILEKLFGINPETVILY